MLDMLSEVELDQQAGSPASPNTQQECLICFDLPPDAVFMDCGHGGICYSCALDVWKKNSECFLCRKEIRCVYQLEQSSHDEYIKIIAETKRFEKEKSVVEEEDESFVESEASSSIEEKEELGGAEEVEEVEGIEEIEIADDSRRKML